QTSTVISSQRQSAKAAAANEGVTAAESAALFPEDVVDHEPEVQKLVPRNVTKAPVPPSPYPEDVRLKGRIPPGAKPLETAGASESDAQGSNVYRWTAPRAVESRRDSARPNEAASSGGGARVVEPEPELEPEMETEEMHAAEIADADV